MSSYPELMNHGNLDRVDNDPSENDNDGDSQSDDVIYRQYSLINETCASVQAGSSLVCCGDAKTRPWLLRSTFLVVVAFGLFVSYLELRFLTYSPRTISIRSGDQLLLPVSTYINKEVEFSASEGNADNLKLHVLQNIPQISSDVVRYRAGGKFNIASWSYQYWGFHLLEGSLLQISICADLQVQFYVIKSKKKLEKWTQEILYDGYDYHQTIFPNPTCNKRSDFKVYNLTVKHSDVYYVLFSSSAGWRFLTEISLMLQFERTVYNLSNSKYSCMLSNASCVTSLEYGTEDISLVEALKEANIFRNMNLTYSPVPRHSFYLKLFGGSYLSVFAVSTLYIIWRVYANCSNAEGRSILTTMEYKPRKYTRLDSAENPWHVVSSESLLPKEGDSDAERNSSREYMKNHSEALINYMSRNEYNPSQQFLDSCLTSAGTSAI